jgi:hypothetical protein
MHRFKLTLQCCACGAGNNVQYMPLKADEGFTCGKCKQKNLVVMSFLTMPSNPPGTYNMMMKPSEAREMAKES